MEQGGIDCSRSLLKFRTETGRNGRGDSSKERTERSTEMDEKGSRSIGDLFSDLSKDLRNLVRQEMDLAKTEMSRKASRAGKDIAYIAVGGAIAYAGFLAILGAIVILIGKIVPWWASAFIVGIVVGGIGYTFVAKGRRDLKREQFKPEQTIETLREDKEWMKRQTT